jgi:uncharacterized membrane protein
MDPITITQDGVTATLHDVYFSPATQHTENGTVYSIESSISASSNVVLTDGEAQLSYDDQYYPVTVTVLEFDEDDDDIDDVDGESPACQIMLDSAALPLEKLADFLDLET